MKPTQSDEAGEILKSLRAKLPSVVDGREAIISMKAAGSRNWRQMEWIGFWFEHFVESNYSGIDGFSRGPVFGRVEFDLAKDYVWDLKAHPDQAGNIVILNDQEAVRRVIETKGGLGYVIVRGDADYDDEVGTFKNWHNEQKGKKTPYVLKNEAKGAPSRRRKTKFAPALVAVYWLSSIEDIEEGLRDGWLGHFQTGMSNSNGKPRRSKFTMKLDVMPAKYLIAVETF